MSGIATAVIGSAVIGAVTSNKASKRAAKSAQKGLDANQALLGPFSDAGQAGLGAVQSFVDEGARFSDTQAYKDITNSAKAGGMNLSGNRLTALSDYYATNFRNQRLNELMQLPTLGANAAAGQATNAGNLNMAQGNAQAAGIMGIGNSAISGLNSLAFLNQGNYGGGANSGFGNQNYGTYGFNPVNQAYNPQGNISQSHNPYFNRSLLTGG